MVYTYKELLKKYKSRNEINKLISSNKLFKLEKGIYSNIEIEDPLIVYSLLYPSAIITMDSALYFYDLTDVIPDKVYLATKNNYRKIKNKNIKQIYVSRDKLDFGKTQIKLKDNKINIYDRERLLVEFIRKRNSIPFDYYKEVINNYRKIVHELDAYKIEDYLSLYKNETSIADVIQREVY